MYDKDLTHRYRLETYDSRIKKHICPACEHRTFVRYIDTETGEYVSTDVGRCDREQKCGYHKRPRDHFAEHGGAPKKEYYFPKKIPPRKLSPYTFSVISGDLVYQTLTHYERNYFVRWMNKKFGDFPTRLALDMYKVGTAKYWPGATIFWQCDIKGRYRTGKIMLYNWFDGHRIKKPGSKISWVHTMHGFKDFHLNQCLFGEHLIDDNEEPICIVESEKTAIIASMFFPDATWLATGGLNNLQEEKLKCLTGHDIILFPDLDAFDNWNAKAREIPALKNAKVSTWLLRNSTEEDRKQGLDLGDYLIQLPSVRALRLKDYL